MENVRILIADLIMACRLLGDVHVVAAGSMYATLETSDEQRDTLSRYRVSWIID